MQKRDSHTEGRMAHYEAANPNDKLIINLRDINHTMRHLYEGRGSQKRILIILSETGAITQKQLTERLGIQPGSASEVLAKLEKNGWIARTEHPSDRRTTDITLTEQGWVSANNAKEQRRKRHEEMFACLNDEEKRMLLSLLEKVNTDWQNRYPDRKENGCKRHKKHHSFREED